MTLDYGDATAVKEMSKGCVQGSVCGPTFWNLILDELLETPLPNGCHIKAFADDVLLLVSANSVQDIQAANNDALKVIADWGESLKLRFSQAKTQAIAFTRASTTATIDMNGVSFPLKTTSNFSASLSTKT